MEEDQVQAIGDAWLERSGVEPGALLAFLRDGMPDVEAWALRRTGPRDGREPEVLALSDAHLYRITASAIDGHRAFGFERWALGDIAVALVEWVEGDTRRRRWTLRMGDTAFTVDTDESPGGEPSATELLMRVLLSRAR